MLQKEGEVRIPSGCAIAAIINRKGEVFSGEDIIRSIALMHDRGNGLGGGFAAYGIYPDYKEFTAFHIFYDTKEAQMKTEAFLKRHFEIEKSEKIPTRKVKGIGRSPIIMRYFAQPLSHKIQESGLPEAEFIAQCVFRINSEYGGAFVFSSGKNMGAFKAVGFPEDVGEFYMLDDYKGYSWTAHGRFPTNTPGWWGGAHPFTLLDWSIVHNGEISSYDANRRFVEMFGYQCNLKTDTEAITYLFDYLIRKQGLSYQTAAEILTAPEWRMIDRMDEEKKEYYTTLRTMYSGALISGPFSIILGFEGGLLALNDRLKLRSLMMAQKGDFTYFASEESAIWEICDSPEDVRFVGGGEPIIIRVEEGK